MASQVLKSVDVVEVKNASATGSQLGQILNPWPHLNEFFLIKSREGDKLIFDCALCLPKTVSINAHKTSLNNLKQHIKRTHQAKFVQFEEKIKGGSSRGKAKQRFSWASDSGSSTKAFQHGFAEAFSIIATGIGEPQLAVRRGNENQNEDDGSFAYEFNTTNKSSTSFVDDDENLSLGYSNEPYDDLPRSETAFEDCGEKEEFVTPASFNRKRKKQSAVLDGLDPIGQDDAKKNTEFDIFGNGVAAQLNNLPFVNALELQLQIQQLISRYRLAMQKQPGSSTSQVHGAEIKSSVGQKQNGASQEHESTSAILSNKFDEQIFGDYVASSLRSLRSDENKDILKRKIQKGIIEVSDVDKSITVPTKTKTTMETPEADTGNLNDGIGTSKFGIEETIKEEPVETGIFVDPDPLIEDADTLTPAFKKRKTDSKADSNLADTLNMISGNYLSDSKKAKEFELFGIGVAAQLNNMPFINAIELQSKIQQLISQYRLNYAHCKIKELQT